MRRMKHVTFVAVGAGRVTNMGAVNQALADAASPEQIHAMSQQREEVLNELQANALVSQAWMNWAYAMPDISSYSWIGVPGVNGLLLQAQRLYPRHRHLPRVRQMLTPPPGAPSLAPPGISSPPPRPSLLVPLPHALRVPPASQAVVPGSVGAIVNAPAPKAAPSVPHQFSSSSTPYHLHPSHFWRPSPPNIHTPPSVPTPSASMSPRHFGGRGHSGGGGHFRGGGGRRGR